MTRLWVKTIGLVLGLLALAAGIFWLRYLRDLPRISVDLRPLDLAGAELPGLHDCFWMGPVFSDRFNIAFPDEAALYWPSVFTPPHPGDILEITGTFAQARYLSFNTYENGGVPHDRLTDRDILPDPESINPYREGRFETNQAYTIRIVHGPIPADRPANTLYFPATPDAVPLIMRLYLPETPDDVSGGAGLPRVALLRADGPELTGEALCAALGNARIADRNRTIRAPLIPVEVYTALFDNADVRDAVLDAPGGTWNLFWSPRLSVLRTAAPALAGLWAGGARLGLISRRSGFYANGDTDYVSTYINARFGDLVVLTGRLPRTPANGAEVATGDHDMRFWSLCTNEGLASTRFADCVHDREVAVDADRRYRIVVSKSSDRPTNARPACGVTWLDWGDAGDGAGHTNLGILILRNMLPDPDFAHAIQRVPRPGDEHAVMGDYLPELRYETRQAFEALGCP